MASAQHRPGKYEAACDRAAEREEWAHPMNSASPFFEAKEWLVKHIDTHSYLAWLIPKLWRRSALEMARKKAC